MAGIFQKPPVALILVVMACCLCIVLASANFIEKPDVEITAFLLEPAGSPERSTVLIPPSERFPEVSRFGQVQVFDAPVLLKPDTSNGEKIASFQGFLLYTSDTVRSITVASSLVFQENSDYPAGTRLYLFGSFETADLEKGKGATLSILGGTGPLIRATGSAAYEFVPEAGGPGELFFRLTLSIYLPGGKQSRI